MNGLDEQWNGINGLDKWSVQWKNQMGKSMELTGMDK